MDVPSIALNNLLATAVKRGASSLHLSTGNRPMMRIDRSLVAAQEEQIISLEMINGVINSFVEERDIRELKTNRETVIVKEFGNNLRFRVNIFYQKDLPALSFYHIPNTPFAFRDLGFPHQIDKVLFGNTGLFIVAGPFNSGKTTTIASIINKINSESGKYIVTLEDPIEYLYSGEKSIINQRQVGRDMEHMVSGLKFCLDEDVDVVYVGKIRDYFSEAVHLLLNLASGNALVLLEMNANSVVGVIKRMVDSANSRLSARAIRYNLLDVLRGVVVQKLYPRQGGGLALATEIMIMNPGIQSLIAEDKINQINNIINTSLSEGMHSMNKSIDDLKKSGVIKNY